MIKNKNRNPEENSANFVCCYDESIITDSLERVIFSLIVWPAVHISHFCASLAILMARHFSYADKIIMKC